MRIERRRETRLAAVLVLLTLSLSGHARELTPDAAESGRQPIGVQDDYRMATPPNSGGGLHTHGPVANVSVRQSLGDEGSEWAEGIYVFPLPEAASRTGIREGDEAPARPAAEGSASEPAADLMPYGRSGGAAFGLQATATNTVRPLLCGLALLISGLMLFALHWISAARGNAAAV
ncbi:MAG: hypothetical protein AAFX56_11800 [Pseudomonadota bacterium]